MGLSTKLTITLKDDGKIKMDVEATGKYKRKAGWEDISAYSGHDVTSDLLKDWIYNYQKQNFPEALDKPNHRPFKCFIYDEPKKGFTIFKDYNWAPVKLEMKGALAEVKQKVTKKVTLIEAFSWEEMEAKLNENAGLQLVSTIKKHKLQGHPLALEMMKSTSTIDTEFKGFEKEGFFVTNVQNEADEIDDKSGAEVWKSLKTLGDLLDGVELPEQKEAGYRHEVAAIESTVKARVYYKAFFTGEVSTDHKEQYDGRRFWNFPLKYLLQYNDVPKQALIYEDVEFKFYSGVSVCDIEPGAMNITVVDHEGNTHQIQVKPADTVESVKQKVEQVTGIAGSRQVLKYDGQEMRSEDGKNMEDLGLKDGSKITMELFKIPMKVDCPDGRVLELWIEPCSTIETLKEILEEETNIKVDKQILKLEKKKVSDGTGQGSGNRSQAKGASADGTSQGNGNGSKTKGVSDGSSEGNGNGINTGGGSDGMGLGDGDGTNAKKNSDGTSQGNGIHAKDAKDGGANQGNGIKASKARDGSASQGNGIKEIKDGTIQSNGIQAGDKLLLTEDFDPIIFVDIKCGTLFALDRKEVIERNALTPVNDNEEEFQETMKSKDERAQILANMKESPNLGVNPNKVVEKKVVRSLGVQEHESVKDIWGVSLKTVEQNKKGEELYFLDVQTGAAGELLRNKYIKMKFITPIQEAENKQILKEAEKDHRTYDKYIGYIRRAFGIEIIPRGV